MGTGFRLGIAAAVIAGAVAIFSVTLLIGHSIGWTGGFFDAQRHGYSLQSSTETDARVAQCFATSQSINAARECATAAIRASREAERDEANLNAQQKMADWSHWVLIVSMLQLPISAIGIIGLLFTIRQGREANETTREALVLENRAWLKVSSTGHDDIYASPEGALVTSVTILVRNAGKGVAKDVSARCMLAVGSFDVESRDDDHKLTLYGGSWSDHQDVKRSAVLFPEDELEVVAESVVLHDVQEVARESIAHAYEPGDAQLYLLLQAQYRLVVDPPSAPFRITEALLCLDILNGHSEGRHRLGLVDSWVYVTSPAFGRDELIT